MREKKKLIVIAALAAIASAIFILVYFAEVYQTKKQYEEIQEEILRKAHDAERSAKQEAVRKSVEEKLLAEEEARREQEERQKEKERRWAELENQNRDIYAWISIPDLEIEYPVLQNEKDDFYLNHNADREWEAAGSIYSNSCNKKDFSDVNTVLYGHNMKNGTMFGKLSDIGETQLKENGVVYIYTRDKKLTYLIYAAVEFSDVYLPDAYSVRSQKGLASFVKAVDKSSSYFRREGMEIKEEDKVLTLSTCVGGNGTKRCLVVARLDKDEPYVSCW